MVFFPGPRDASVWRVGPVCVCTCVCTCVCLCVWPDKIPVVACDIPVVILICCEAAGWFSLVETEGEVGGGPTYSMMMMCFLVLLD